MEHTKIDIDKLTFKQKQEYFNWYAKTYDSVKNNPSKLSKKELDKVCAGYTYEEIQRMAGNPLYKKSNK